MLVDSLQDAGKQFRVDIACEELAEVLRVKHSALQVPVSNVGLVLA